MLAHRILGGVRIPVSDGFVDALVLHQGDSAVQVGWIEPEHVQMAVSLDVSLLDHLVSGGRQDQIMETCVVSH